MVRQDSLSFSYYHLLIIIIICYTVRCVHPLHLLVNEQLMIKAESPQLLMPSNINVSLSFSCKSPGVLTGPNSATCMEDGNWEPDPREVECKGIYF